MIISIFLPRLGTVLKGAGVALCLSLAACAGGQSPAVTPIEMPRHVELLSGDANALNYTPWYIHTFSMIGPSGSGIGGGGPNVMPVRADGRPSEGGGMCCTSLPAEWQPDLKLTVRWLVDKKQDGKTPGYWYKADNVRIAPYSTGNTGDAWAIFLPGDRVRIMLTDGNHDGGNNPNNRPADNDPYIAQGVIDEEWNRLYRKGGMR
ncbi:DUF3304 domain-containing protein [Burkholderia vietnamiensis]|uniref:DUF3304 domain-containing protein n=1 Tax=Burkholderia vietnamiensis TaxID=60552 RepID=UPI0009BE1A97|nr:DUF3304 domain-containing protein [Burkholderia vietnamiensis]MCA8446655.1 DUF3304 domain-containing protein [Burkholderia vietnamiensis]MDN7665078.1 DUF3304 domain-containing protein [Burkholderia vietnamiensis]HDR8952807.1 DUF3304 domain-containing protein [Burkholderia vietnamiensis]